MPHYVPTSPEDSTRYFRHIAGTLGHIVVEDDTCPECGTIVPIVEGAQFATCQWCGEHFTPMIVLRAGIAS